MKLKFLSLAVIVAFSALAFVSFEVGGETAQAKAFAARFADGKLTAEESTGSFELDPNHSHIGFRITHMGLAEVPGAFRDFTGTIVYNGKDASKSSVNFTAKVKSVDTGVDRRDGHLRSKDFFEVETFPDMTFKSTKVEKKGKDWLVTGDFMMKGVTKQISFPFTVVGFKKDAKGAVKMGVTAETSINRRDFGVNYGGNMPDGTPMLSDNIAVVLQLECAMQKAQ